MSSPSGKRKADALDFTAPPNTTNATRTKGPSRVWNRCWAHTDVDAKGTQVPNGRYSLMVPNYPFTDEEGKAAAELMAKVALQQGTVEYKDHSKDNPTRRNEIVAYFYTPKGLGVLKQEAQKALGKPLSDTKGMECVKKPELRVSIGEEQIEVTGDVRWLKDYFPMFNGEMVTDPNTYARKAVFPKDDPEFVMEALNKLAEQMGYSLQEV